MNITESLQPKSDQLNADDLLTAPLTITVKEVTRGSAEQPVSIQWVGGEGRPYKPSKSMRRVIAVAWGVESTAYTGRRMTLYRDPSVRYAGQDVGGIRISHMSDIKDSLKLALTVTRGKRESITVQPLVGRDLVAEGDNAASQGVEALRTFWASLSKQEQAMLKDKIDGWKQQTA